MRVILIGYMGSGKSSLGKRVARALGIPFIDSDAEISRKTGKSTSEIFEKEGENRFRTLEKELILSLDPTESFVLATGGGLPCFNNLMNELNKLGTTIYLKHNPNNLAKRLTVSKTNRPLIQNHIASGTLLEFIEDHLKGREKIYNQAHVIAPSWVVKPHQLIDFAKLNQKS